MRALLFFSLLLFFFLRGIRSIGSILIYFCIYARRIDESIFTELIPLRKHITRLHYTSVGGSGKPFFLSLSLSAFVRSETTLFDSYDLR